MKLTREINADISARLPDNAKRQKLVSFIIKRLKEELPQGVESVSKDSLNVISSKIGMEYGYANGNNTNTGLVPRLVPWSPKIEKSLHDAFLKDATDANRNENEMLYNCVIKGLKKINSDSVMIPFTHDMIQTVAKNCYLDLNKK